MGRRYVRHRLYMVRPVQAGSVKPRRPVSTPGRTPISENLPASRKDKEYGIEIENDSRKPNDNQPKRSLLRRLAAFLNDMVAEIIDALEL